MIFALLKILVLLDDHLGMNWSSVYRLHIRSQDKPKEHCAEIW